MILDHISERSGQSTLDIDLAEMPGSRAASWRKASRTIQHHGRKPPKPPRRQVERIIARAGESAAQESRLDS